MGNEQHDIEAIIKGCIRKDRKSQELLYRNYYRAMMTICTRYTRNEEDAVEVLNNGFLKVFTHIERYDGAQGALFTWIRTIVVNSCLDFIKKRQRSVQAGELKEVTEVHIPADVIGKMKAAEILKLVRQLPPATAAVFNLYVVEGYNHREIGKLLDISEGTSKWHLSEARKNMQKMIQKIDQEIYE